MTSDLKYSIAASVQRCLHAGFCVCWSVHIGQKRDSFNPQTVYDDMHMNVAGVVVSVRVGADNGLVSGEMLSAKFLAQRLRLINGQTVVRSVPWVKADNIVVDFLHLPVFGSCHSGDWSAYRQRQNLPRRSSAWLFGSPHGASRPFSSRVGFMVNSSCSKVRYCSAAP